MQHTHCRCSLSESLMIIENHPPFAMFPVNLHVGRNLSPWSPIAAAVSGCYLGGGWTSSLGESDFCDNFTARKQRWLAGKSTLNSKSVSCWKWWFSQPVMLLIFKQHWGWPRSGKQVNTIGPVGYHYLFKWTPICASLLDMITQIDIHSIYNHYSIH